MQSAGGLEEGVRTGLCVFQGVVNSWRSLEGVAVTGGCDGVRAMAESPVGGVRSFVARPDVK